MSKIKEIRKIQPDIKEIKKEKVESLDDEVEIEEIDEENVVFNNGVRRFNKTSTLAANEIPQETVRERRISKEDEQEVNFRPSYTGGGNPYESKNYTPVGSAESSAARESRQTERGFDNRNELRVQEQEQGQMRGGERQGERQYAGERDQDRKDKRRNMM